MSNIYTRVHNKKDSDESWRQLNPTLHDGEIILVSIGEDIRYKIGDGTTDYLNLPFIDSDLREEMSTIDASIRADISEELKEVDSDIEELKDLLDDKVDDEELSALESNIVGILHSLNTKMPSNLPAEYAGKYLGIDETGKIVPMDPPAGGGSGLPSGGLTWGDLKDITSK